MKKLVHGAWCMVLGALVALATGAAMAKESVTYLDYDVSTDAFTERTKSCEIVTSGTTELADGGWYAVKSDVVINDKCNITVSGSAHLILCDGATLKVAKVPYNNAAIEVLEGKALTIYGQRNGTGKLVATGGEDGAGIGSGGHDNWGRGQKCGMVTINGGMVTATGGADAAGIGGGLDGVGGTVTINGGMVTANGKGGGKGIGAGSGVGGATLTIRNGTVVAEGWNGFDGYSTCSLTFDGGNIMASSIGNEYESIAGPLPRNSNKDDVYCVTVEGLESLERLGGWEGLEGYGTKDIVPIEGKLYLYLPHGDYRFTVGGRTYVASVDNGPTTATLVATPPAVAYTVTFDMQEHGAQVADITGVASGDKVSEPDKPQADGYVFGGWFKESGCANEWDFATDIVTADVTLYAKWTEEVAPPVVVTYTVTFDMQEHGAQVADITGVASGDKVSEPDKPQADGYVFGGWFKESECENEWDFATDSVTENVTLYAKWTEESGPDEPTWTEGSEGNPWKIGSPNEEDVTAYVKDGTLFIAGTGEMCNFEGSWDTPWTEVAGKLTAVEIGEGVTSIGESAFIECISLESVMIPEGVTSIGYAAFNGCYRLASVEIPEGVTSIGSSAFSGCALTSVTIPEGVTSIGSSAFSGCALTSVEIPEGVTSIGEDMFNGCQQLESVTLPKGVTSIGAYAFYDCSVLSSVEIPEGVTSIGDSAFSGCALTSVTIPSTVERIGNNAFQRCMRLTSVTVLATIPPECGWDAFADCGIDFGDFVIRVPKDRVMDYLDAWSEYADKIFAEDEEWFSVEFDFQEHGEPVRIEVKAMCTMEKPNDPEADGYLFGGWFKEWYCENEWDFATDIVTESITLYAKWTEVPPGSEGNPWKIDATDEDNVLAWVDGTTLIIEGTGKMRDFWRLGDIPWWDVHDQLTAVEIGEGVTSIGSSAFSGCALTSVTIPEGVTSIDDYAFYGCEALTGVTIPSTVKWIGDNAFEGCQKLASVTVLATIPPEAGKSMFEDCHDDLLIFVPRARVGDYQAEWSAYEEIIKPSTVELALTAGEGYGYVVSNLTKSVEIVAEDGKYALPIGASVGIYAVAKDGYAISAVEPLVIEKVDESTKVEDKDLPTPTVYAPGSKDNPWKIGATDEDNVLAWIYRTTLIIEGTGNMRGFYDEEDWPWYEVAGELTAVEIRKGVTSIGDSAFLDCQKLASVKIPEGVTSIGYAAFNGCYRLASVEIPEGVTSIDNDAFSGCDELGSVTIPSTVKWIGDNAFRHCMRLTSVTVLATIPPECGLNAFADCCIDCGDFVIQVPRGCATKYRDAWSEYADKIYAEDIRMCDVTFDVQGHGEWIASIKVEEGCTVEKPVDPQADGYVFGGWFKESMCENEWDFATDTVTDTITLYAKWTEVPPGSEGNPWKIGSPNAADVTAYVKDGSLVIAGSGAMSNFTNVAEAPWAAVAGKVMAVTVEEGVTLGVNALSGMLGTTTVNGTPLSFYDMVAGARGASGSSLPEGTIPVSKTELEAAGAATLTIVDGTAYVGVVVRTNGDLTAKTKSWGRVKFADTTKVGLSEDGTEIVIPVPANAEKGFMVLESKGADPSNRSGRPDTADIQHD